MKSLEKLTSRDLSHIAYSFGVRGAGNPELHAAIEKQLENTVREMDYPSLFNTIYYLLFRENANQNLWRQIVENTIRKEEVLPLIYFRPFKASLIFLNHHFPQWDANRNENGSLISDYSDKFFHAEKYFNVVKFDDLYESDMAYKDFRAFLTGHCNVYPTPFMTVHNLFTMHYVFYEQKIAI